MLPLQTFAMRSFNETAHLKDTHRAQLEGAPHYEIDENGFVYHTVTGKRVRLQNRCGKWFAQVYREDGTRWSFDTEKKANEVFRGSGEELSLDDIYDKIGARDIPRFSRYAVTSYGAVYCIKPPKRGPNAGRYYLLRETLRRGDVYVTLTRDDGVRCPVRVDKVTDMVWEH
jgi:hypothetical protein